MSGLAISAAVSIVAACAGQLSVPSDAAVPPDAAAIDLAPACVNLQCRQVACGGGARTAVRGVVYAPTRTDPDPLPNVDVYVPNAPVLAFTPGASCNTCDDGLSGSPLVRTISAADGTFRLDDVPAGVEFPLVIQSGRWRRQVMVKAVPACTVATLPADTTRLPRSRAEGDIPLMALQTGYNDALECTLAKILDVAEMTAPTGPGRVHLYRASGKDMDPPLPPGSALWTDAAQLRRYDIVLMPCSASNVLYEIPQMGVKNLVDYANLGGRLYITHAGGSWMTATPAPFPDLITFNNQPDPKPLIGIVDASFPKGKIFADWLEQVGVTARRGELSITRPQWYIDAVRAPAQRWVHTTSPATIQHFTFNTPLGVAKEKQCGRVLFSNFHVQGEGSGKFPSSCAPGPLSPEERLVEFMLFDVTACVRPDDVPIQ